MSLKLKTDTSGTTSPNKYKMYYYPNKLFSYDPAKYWFYICIGSRGRGKTVSAWRWVLKRFIKHGEMFVWLRLTEAPVKKASRNDSNTLVPKFILQQLRLDSVFMKGSTIYVNKEINGKIHTMTAGIMDSISTFYSSKGQDMSEFTNVVFDEINRESGERNTFDVTRAFINQIETIVRMRKIRVLMLGNTISDTSDILGLFNFQPKEFGIYKLTRKHAIIEYLEDSEEFKQARKNSMAGVLLGDNEDVNASFNNKSLSYKDNVEKYDGQKPLFIYYIGEFKAYGVYEPKGASRTSSDNRGLYVGEVRQSDLQKFKLSPFFNCEGVYDKAIYESFYQLISANNLTFETLMVRSRFVRALKNNRTALS